MQLDWAASYGGPVSVAPASTYTRFSQLPGDLGLGEVHPVKHMMLCHGALFNFLKMSNKPMYPDREDDHSTVSGKTISRF